MNYRIQALLKIATISLLFSTGCSHGPFPEQLFSTYRYREACSQLEGDEGIVDVEDGDYVMLNMQSGSAYMYMGDMKNAEKHFSNATSIVDTSIGTGRGVVSTILWESARYFKGEGYERSALYYYRGLINYIAGRLDTARASFYNATLADKASTEEQYQEDNAAAFYFLARSFLELGDTNNAKISMGKAKNALPENNFLTLEEASTANLVLLVETGLGPKLWASEDELRYLVIRPAPTGKPGKPEIYIDGRKSGSAEIIVDWGHQAATEGTKGRDILQTTKAVTTGILKSRLCCGVGHLCSLAVKADVRAWRLIPDKVWLYTANVTPGAHTINIKFPIEDEYSWVIDYRNVTYGWFSNTPRIGNIAVANQGGYAAAFEETHYHIGIPEDGYQVVLIRNGLAKQAKQGESRVFK